MLTLYAFFALRYRVPNQNFFFTPVYMLAAVYIGLGVHATGWARRRAGIGVLLVLAVLVIPMYWAIAGAARAVRFPLREAGQMHEIPYRDVYAYYLLPWQCHQTGPRRFATEVLGALPEGAVLLPDTTTAPPLKCLHDVERERPDVRIVDPYDAKFDSSLAPYWGGKDVPPPALCQGRRLFVVSDQEAYIPGWVTTHGRLNSDDHLPGILWEVEVRGSEAAP